MHRIRKSGQVGHPRPFLSWAHDYLEDAGLNVSRVELSEKKGAFPGVVYVEGDVRAVRDKKRLKIGRLIFVCIIFPITILWFLLAAKSLSEFVIASDRLGIDTTLEGEMYTGAAAKEHGVGIGNEAISEHPTAGTGTGTAGVQSADRATVVSDIRVTVTVLSELSAPVEIQST